MVGVAHQHNQEPLGLARPSQRALPLVSLLLVLLACTRTTPAPTALPPTRTPAPLPPVINLDVDTQTLIANAHRVAFIIPFPHWDTDWHEAYPSYVKCSDGNILRAIEMAEADPRFRYALEQVLFVQYLRRPISQSHCRLQRRPNLISFPMGQPSPIPSACFRPNMSA